MWGVSGGGSGPTDGDIGDVDGGDGPTVASQPNGVGALAATNVERSTRGQVGDLSDEPSIGSPAPHRAVPLGVPGVPLVGLRGSTESLVVAVSVSVHDQHGRPPATPVHPPGVNAARPSSAHHWKCRRWPPNSV